MRNTVGGINLPSAPDPERGRVHVRVPTYKRPDLLRRALLSLQAQTWTDWVCDVFDDDPDAAGREVCRVLNDARIHYSQNKPQKYASGNINACFSLNNPRDADYFCVVEDDNYLLPDFMAENIALCLQHKVNLVLRNQKIEYHNQVDAPTLSAGGLLDERFNEGIYAPEVFRLSLIMGIGISNGGLFWTRDARSPLEVACASSAVLQEYIRTFTLDEPIYVAMAPLAVWMENAAATTRNDGDQAAFVQRELNLKRAIQLLQRAAWHRAGEGRRQDFVSNPAFRSPADVRERGLIKAHLLFRRKHVSLKEAIELLLRGTLIRLGGKTTAGFDELVKKK